MRHSAAGNGTGSTLRCYRRGTRTVRLLRNKKSQERKPGNANAGHPDRHEKARSELTGAAGSHTSSAPRVLGFILFLGIMTMALAGLNSAGRQDATEVVSSATE